MELIYLNSLQRAALNEPCGPVWPDPDGSFTAVSDGLRVSGRKAVEVPFVLDQAERLLVSVDVRFVAPWTGSQKPLGIRGPYRDSPLGLVYKTGTDVTLAVGFDSVVLATGEWHNFQWILGRSFQEGGWFKRDGTVRVNGLNVGAAQVSDIESGGAHHFVMGAMDSPVITPGPTEYRNVIIAKLDASESFLRRPTVDCLVPDATVTAELEGSDGNKVDNHLLVGGKPGGTYVEGTSGNDTYTYTLDDTKVVVGAVARAHGSFPVFGATPPFVVTADETVTSMTGGWIETAVTGTVDGYEMTVGCG